MGKIKKMLIIQPHSDDALFCCFNFLLASNCKVRILTVENDVKRIAEDTKLYGFLNIPYSHLNVEFKDESYYGYNKEYSEVTIEDSLNYLEGYFGKKTLKEIEEAIVKWVNNFMKKNPGYEILVPWGVGHPFHLFVRNVCEMRLPEKFIYYRDFPHSFKKRSRLQVEKQKETYRLVSSVEVEEFHDVKWKLASKFYRTQSGFLFYEQGYIRKKLPEEFYKKN